MKRKITTLLSVMLAGMLQLLPVLRSVVPTAATPTGALILRWAVGGVALMGYHAISGASTSNLKIAISPPTATVGTFYSGSLAWTGSYSSSANSMSVNGNCVVGTPYAFSPGLSIVYNTQSTATISGTPTASNSLSLNCEIWQTSGCTANGTHEAIRTSPAFVVNPVGGAPSAPSFNNLPQNQLAVVGQTVSLFGSATGNASPQYYWSQNLVPISGATNASYTIAAPQVANAGTYSLMASNATAHPSAFCVLSVCVPPGTNFDVLNWTNYAPAGVALTMNSFITNTATATNSYQWGFNNVNIPGTAGGTNQNLSLSAAQTVPSKSGLYSIYFTSVNGTNVYANAVEFDTTWAFGYVPVVTNQPAPLTVGTGSNATFSFTMAGGNYAVVSLYQNQTNLVAQTNLSAYNPNTAATTNLSLTVSNVTPANAGNYTFVITNFWGSTTSSPAALTVSSPLAVSSPSGQTNYAGKNISFSVTASGTAPFSYQWQKGGSNLANGGNLSGATTNILSIASATTTNSGNYRVVVTNSSGSVTSSIAALSILPVPSFALSLGSSNVTLNATGGIAGSNYVVQVSTDLSGGGVWVPIQTNVVPPNGVINFTDTNALNPGPRFYRVQFP